MTSSTISGIIISGGYGGGFNSEGILTVTSSTLSGNAVGPGGNGGGIFNIGTGTITASTISRNSAGPGGGAGGVQGFATIGSSIVAAQTLGPDCGSTLTSTGYNIESATSCGFASTGDQQNVTTSALHLGPLADNGGPTQTHALLTPSAAIDKIPTSVSSCSGTDQRGVLRPQGTMCDVGAFEATPTTPPAPGSSPGGATPPGAAPDTTPPDTTITSGPNRSTMSKQTNYPSTRDRTPSFEFVSTEAGSTFQCSVDDASFTSCTSPHTTDKLSRGELHTLSVRAIDSAGNVDPTPASITFKVKQKHTR
jgi:hypothetical protein